MPGIPVGDHYPGTHSAGAPPPQVPTGLLQVQERFPLRHSSVQTTEALLSDTAGPFSGTFLAPDAAASMLMELWGFLGSWGGISRRVD